MTLPTPSASTPHSPTSPTSFKRVFTLKSALVFLTSKAIRSGPRALLHITVILVIGFFVTRVWLGGYKLPARVKDYDYSEVWDWVTGDGDGGGGDGDGGLRIVVFGGAGDIGMPPRMEGDHGVVLGRSWTERLCDELSCSSHISYIPSSPGISLTSTSIHNKTITDMRRRIGNHPESGLNHDFLETQYPIPFHLPDFDQQISTFLSSSPPSYFPSSGLLRPKPPPPRETIYVLSFGIWDIWNLAALPLDVGHHAVDQLVRHIFAGVEDLYQEGRDRNSIAYSAGSIMKTTDTDTDATASSSTTTTTKSTSEAAGKEGTLEDAIMTLSGLQQREEKQHTTQDGTVRRKDFRIIMPRIPDPSLMPAWKARPAPPHPHNRAEHLKNAAYLTLRWNARVREHVKAWVMTIDPEPEEENLAIGRKEAEKRDLNEGKVGMKTQKPEQLALRDAIVLDMSKYVVDSIMDAQMKKTGIRDNTPGSGVGALPKEEAFEETMKGCVSVGAAVRWGYYEIAESVAEDSREVKESDTNPNSNTTTTTTTETTETNLEALKLEETAESTEIGGPCSRYLFTTPRHLSPKAIDALGDWAAEMVVRNVTVRMGLEMALASGGRKIKGQRGGKGKDTVVGDRVVKGKGKGGKVF